MLAVIVGHRGTGKSDLLKRIQHYKKDAIIFDLDNYIEEKENQSISQIFKIEGQEKFRDLEKKYFDEIYESYLNDHRKDFQEKINFKNFIGRFSFFDIFDIVRHPHMMRIGVHFTLKIFGLLRNLALKDFNYFISVGAGFPLRALPEDVYVIYLKRGTDFKGRIFIDRPPLTDCTTPLEEWAQIFSERNQEYETKSHETLEIQEGFNRWNHGESLYFQSSEDLLRNPPLGGAMTILPHYCKDKQFLDFWLEKRLSWGIDFFEFRDDLLNYEQMKTLSKRIPKNKILFSFRKKDQINESLDFLNQSLGADVKSDWALELGEPREKHFIVSLHQKLKNLRDCQKILDPYSDDYLLKLAVPIENYKELQRGHQWWLEDKAQRIFLPCSSEGKWSWYRLLQKNRLLLNFIREGRSEEQLDQPLVTEWALTPALVEGFAAILGSPVDHSFTPSFHHEFFSQKDMPVLRIDMKEEEFNEALKVLIDFGLRATAVTSPLKKLAAQIVKGYPKDTANTLFIDRQKNIFATNTDPLGLKKLCEQVSPHDRVAVWGGGGTQEALREHFDKAQFFSARTGEPRNSKNIERDWHPDTVIWAVPRSRHSSWPPSHWKPKKIIDLNYTEDSPGLEYAHRQKCFYQNGQLLFNEQARHQQIFWQECGEF